MYTATIMISEENAQDILIGFNLLMLYEVREAAGEVLGKLIDHNNVLLICSPWPATSPSVTWRPGLTISCWRGSRW